jgi:hypothetical protein
LYGEGGAADEQEAALAAFGLKFEIPARHDNTGCWPDNWQVLQVFEAMRTQWNVVQGLVTGLRYEAIPVVMQMMGIRSKARGEIFNDLRVMENEALQVLNKRNGE